MMAKTDYDEKASNVTLLCRHVEYNQSPAEREATSGERAWFALSTLLTLPLWGWCVSLSFGWFVAPIFGFQQINLWQGAGLALFVSILRYKLGTRHVSASELAYRAIEEWIAPLFIIAIFWVFARLFLGTA